MSDFESLEVQGWKRSEALRRIRLQCAEWGISLPDTTPLMLHFGLEDFYSQGETEFWVVNQTDAGYCAKLMFVFDGQECPYHHHRNKHETFYVLKGTARIAVEEETKDYPSGSVLQLPPGTGHSFRGHEGAALLLEISMPSVPGDSYFPDARIGNNGIL